MDKNNDLPILVKINQSYRDYYNTLLNSGKLTHKTTELGLWGYSITEEVLNLFDAINIRQFKNMIDLGSGDGKVVNLASVFTNATGIECDDELIAVSNTIKQKHNLKSTFIKGNFLEHDLSQYDLLFIYPDQKIMKLEQKLRNELNGMLVVMGSRFHPLQLEKVKEIRVGINIVSVYRNSQLQ